MHPLTAPTHYTLTNQSGNDPDVYNSSALTILESFEEYEQISEPTISYARAFSVEIDWLVAKADRSHMQS